MRVCTASLLALLLLACGCGGKSVEPTGGGGTASQGPTAADLPDLSQMQVVMVISQRDFRDEELFKPKALLEKAGARVVVASSSLQPAKGMLGGTAKPDVLLKDVDPAEYQAVVLVGGPGAKEYWDDETAHRLVRTAAEQGKVVAAICLAPVTLANAGVLDGKKATVWRTESGMLRAQGATYTGADVEVDGRIVTANGPEAADRFGEALAEALAQAQSQSPG